MEARHSWSQEAKWNRTIEEFDSVNVPNPFGGTIRHIIEEYLLSFVLFL